MPSFHGAWSVGSFAGAGVGALAVAAHVSLASQLLVLALPMLAAAAAFNHSLITRQAERDTHERPRSATRERPPPSCATVILGATVFACMLCEGATADWSAVYLRRARPRRPRHRRSRLRRVRAGHGGGTTERRTPPGAPAHQPPSTNPCGAWHRCHDHQALAADTQLTALIGFAFLGAGLALVVPTVFGMPPETSPA